MKHEIKHIIMFVIAFIIFGFLTARSIHSLVAGSITYGDGQNPFLWHTFLTVTLFIIAAFFIKELMESGIIKPFLLSLGIFIMTHIVALVIFIVGITPNDDGEIHGMVVLLPFIYPIFSFPQIFFVFGIIIGLKVVYWILEHWRGLWYSL